MSSNSEEIFDTDADFSGDEGEEEIDLGGDGHGFWRYVGRIFSFRGWSYSGGFPPEGITSDRASKQDSREDS